jgi:hypothetical protein
MILYFAEKMMIMYLRLTLLINVLCQNQMQHFGIFFLNLLSWIDIIIQNYVELHHLRFLSTISVSRHLCTMS